MPDFFDLEGAITHSRSITRFGHSGTISSTCGASQRPLHPPESPAKEKQRNRIELSNLFGTNFPSRVDG